jgi:microcystin-dependent protein
VIYAAGTSDTIGQIVGSNTHELTIAELPRHTHSIPALSGTAESNGAHTHKVQSYMPYGSNWVAGRTSWSASSDSQVNYYLQGTAESAGAHTHSVTTDESITGSQGSGTFIDIRPRRLNSVVWRRTA